MFRPGASGSSPISANDFVAAGAFTQRSGDETSSASQVYLSGIRAGLESGAGEDNLLVSFKFRSDER
jgi:hypothetical protein